MPYLQKHGKINQNASEKTLTKTLKLLLRNIYFKSLPGNNDCKVLLPVKTEQTDQFNVLNFALDDKAEEKI